MSSPGNAGAHEEPDAPTTAALTERVLSTEGVAAVFPVTTPGEVVRAVGSLVTRTTTPAGGVSVSDAGTTRTVSTRIATTADHPTPETARRVADALMRDLADDTTEVRVRVAQIRIAPST